MTGRSFLTIGGTTLQYLKVAADPEELTGPSKEEMVDEFEKSPQANIEEYFQPIIRSLENQYGTKVSLVNPRLETEIGSPSAGFDIVGTLEFPEGRPLKLQKEFEDLPIRFQAYIADGNLVEPIFLELGS